MVIEQHEEQSWLEQLAASMEVVGLKWLVGGWIIGENEDAPSEVMLEFLGKGKNLVGGHVWK